MHERRTVQWREIELAVGAANAEFIARDARMPADIHHAAHAVFEFHQHRGVVFHLHGLDESGGQAAHGGGLAEQIAQQVDAVRSDIAQRPSAGELRIDEDHPRNPSAG